MAPGTISVNRLLLWTSRVPGLRGDVVGTLVGVALPSEGSGGCAMSPGRNGRNTARVSRRDTSRPRGSFRSWGRTESGASHLEARLPRRQGRPARLETQQYSPQGSPPSDTGSGRGGAASAPSASHEGAPDQHSIPGPPVPPCPLESRRLPWPSPLPWPRSEPFARSQRLTCAEHLRAVRPSVALLRAECSHHPAGLTAPPSQPGHHQPALPVPAPPPSPARCWASRLKARAGLHAPDLPARFSPDSGHSLRRVLPQGPGQVTYGWLWLTLTSYDAKQLESLEGDSAGKQGRLFTKSSKQGEQASKLVREHFPQAPVCCPGPVFWLKLGDIFIHLLHHSANKSAH